MSQPKGGGSGGKIIVYPAHVEDAITKMKAFWETGDESMLDALQEYNEWKFTDSELNEIASYMGKPDDQKDYLDYVRQTMFTEEYYPSVFDAELDVPELKRKKAGGGRIKKGITRRDVLKGLGAAGAGALALGKGAVHSGADPEIPTAAVREALETAAPKGFMKQDINPEVWDTVDRYLARKAEGILSDLESYWREPAIGRELTPDEIRHVQDLEHGLEQIEHIRGADPDYVFDDSALEYLDESVDEAMSIAARRMKADPDDFESIPYDTAGRDLMDLDDVMIHIETIYEEPFTEILQKGKPEMAGGGSVKKALARLKAAREMLEEESDPDIDLIGREMMADEDPVIKQTGRRIVANEARVMEMSFEEAQKYYERISRLLDEAESKLAPDQSE